MQHPMPDGPFDDQAGDEDTRLLVAARRDPAAFSTLYSRHSSRVLAFFYRRTFCPHTSADLAAETFAQAYASRHRFDPDGGSGVGWIFGIAGNLHRSWLRKAVVSDRARRRLGMQTPPLVREDYERIETLVDLTTMRAALADGLALLSPLLRDAILLRIALDLPYADVAEHLGCTVGAARVRVARGLDQLLEHLEQVS